MKSIIVAVHLLCEEVKNNVCRQFIFLNKDLYVYLTPFRLILLVDIPFVFRIQSKLGSFK
jgi:hypothetical protein